MSALKALGHERMLQAQRLLASGQHLGVEALLAPALECAALRPEANYLLAIAAIFANDPPSAVDRASKAVAGSPREPRYHFTLGRAHKAAGNLDGAESAYRQAIALDAAYVDAMVSLGIVLKTRGDADGAIALYDRALALSPRSATAHANRANALALRAFQANENARDEPPSVEVIEGAARAAALDPKNPALLRNHAVLLMRATRRAEAAALLNDALSIDPTHPETCLNLGACLRGMGDDKLAIEVYEKWLGLNPPHAVVMRSLAALLTRFGHVDAARELAEKSAVLDLDAYSVMQLGGTLFQSRRHQEAMAQCLRAIEMSGARPDLHSQMLLNANYLYEDPQALFDLHAGFGKLLPQHTPSRPAWRALQQGERLKVGYVSGDFVRHSVSYFLGGLLEFHDKSRFDITCYHNLGWGDATTARLKSYGHRWVDCDGLSDDQLARQIQEDGIHLLIDLAGHTARSRLLMFSRGAAPVQLTYLGYPTISGVPANDFRITDAVIDPEPTDLPAFASEAPLRLGRSMFCYRPDEQPPIGDAPCLRNGFVTFGSFNNIAKVTDHTLDAWAQALNAVPDSRLLLKAAAMAQPSNRDNIERFMAARGIAPDRLTLQPWISGKSTHLEMYNGIDIALDTFPYNGATTTCEALWMGVPVVSLRGRTHTSRMGASILHAIGKTEWVADSDARFVQIAAGLAADAAALSAWRQAARADLQQSGLFDERGFVVDFEQTLQRAWTVAGSRAALVASHELPLWTPT
ncbi:MAG: tetratricopeptide repeat protein [Burkholderiaceae bacterium]|nr:tetratricopeptide repeat protein [Burkholderiaceae bacterium]